MYVLILQHDTPEDFVIATGEYHTVREFTILAFKEVGIELRWDGEGVDEKGIDVSTGKSWLKSILNISVLPKSSSYWVILPRPVRYLAGILPRLLSLNW